MDTPKKQAIQETKTIPGNSIGGQVSKEHILHRFDNDMHCNFGSMGSGNPHTNEIESGEDDKGTFWYFIILKPIVQEVVELFRLVKPKSRSTRIREEGMYTEAAPLRGADLELLATMCALATFIQTTQVCQSRTDHFLQAAAEQQQQNQQQNQQQLHDQVAWSVPHYGLRRHQPLRSMLCFVCKTHLASQLSIEQQMPSVGVAFPRIL
jgi:hypothetical protein